MTASSANHYHSSRFIGKVHHPIHTFFSNARWLTEGSQAMCSTSPSLMSNGSALRLTTFIDFALLRGGRAGVSGVECEKGCGERRGCRWTLGVCGTIWQIVPLLLALI